MERAPRATTAAILGVIGGLFGFISAIGGYALGMLVEFLPWLIPIPEGLAVFVIPKHVAFPLLGIFFVLLGIVGGAMAASEPKLAGLFMIVGAVGGLASVLVLFIPAYLLLFAAAYFAFTPQGLEKVKPSPIWYVFPIFLAIVGGLVGYHGIKKTDEVMAKRLLIVGFIVTIVLVLAVMYIHFVGVPFG